MFLGYSALPKTLSKKEFEDLFIKASSGDANSRKKIIEHNLRLVQSIVGKYAVSDEEKEDYFQLGVVGLMKAIDTFDLSKGKFSTYAGRCIQNEILMELRKKKKHSCVTSYDDAIVTSKDGNSLFVLDTIASDDDIEYDVTKREAYSRVRECVSKLSNKQQKAIILYYGFDGNMPRTHKQIGKMMGFSTSYITRLINTGLESIKVMLESEDEYDLGDIDNMRKVKNYNSVYDLLGEKAGSEEVEKAISELSEKEINILNRRSGGDYHHHKTIETCPTIEGRNMILSLTQEEKSLFYYTILPKLKRKLAKSLKVVDKSKTQEVVAEIPVVAETKNDDSASNCNIPLSKENAEIKVQPPTTRKRRKKNLGKKLIEPTFDLELLSDFRNFINSPTYLDMVKLLSKKDAVILSLRLGAVDGKYFSPDAIAKFLDISVDEVNDVLRNAITLYKEKFDCFLNSLVEYLSRPDPGQDNNKRYFKE